MNRQVRTPAAAPCFLLLVLVIAILAIPAFAAPPTFLGVAELGGERWFALAEPGGGGARWLRLGAIFDGYRVAAYDRGSETLRIEREGNSILLPIDRTEVSPAGRERDRLLAVAGAEAKRRDAWDEGVTLGRPHWFDGNWCIYVHHAVGNRTELRRVILTPTGTVLTYDSPPD